MKTRASLLALLLVAVGACTTDNHSSVELVAVCSTTDDCTFTATCTNTLMGQTGIDAAYTPVRMWIPIQAANQLPNNANVGLGRVNTNDAHVDTVVLEFMGAGLPKTTYPTNQTVPASGTTVLAVDIFPEALNAKAALQAFAPTSTPIPLVVDVSLRGYYGDGQRFETGKFPVAVEVCQGCIPTCTSLGLALTCGYEHQYPKSCK